MNHTLHFPPPLNNLSSTKNLTDQGYSGIYREITSPDIEAVPVAMQEKEAIVIEVLFPVVPKLLDYLLFEIYIC